MRLLEKVLWSLGCLAGVSLCLYTLGMPEDRARLLWNDNDPAWCVPVGIVLMIGCLFWIWLQAWRERR